MNASIFAAASGKFVVCCCICIRLVVSCTCMNIANTYNRILVYMFVYACRRCMAKGPRTHLSGKRHAFTRHASRSAVWFGRQKTQKTRRTQLSHFAKDAPLVVLSQPICRRTVRLIKRFGSSTDFENDNIHETRVLPLQGVSSVDA